TTLNAGRTVSEEDLEAEFAGPIPVLE
ncbi:MAG: hypothetical protein QOJ19_2292, partial [Acidimicrobiia bacterium]|nr:hypothetical protein [Acidimicrobiia bacterium]